MNKLLSIKQIAIIAGAYLLCSCPVKADIRMPRIFGDHMVLQQDSQLSIWGWADPGEKVVVTLAGKKGKAVAGQDGKWKVSLKPIKTKSKGQTLTIKGNNKIIYEDVLVGDVWVASGQSNMEWGINKNHYKKDVDASADSLLRLFFVPRNTSVRYLYARRYPKPRMGCKMGFMYT